MFTYILYTIIGAALVLTGADKLTDGAVGLASRFGISEMVIGLTIVAFGTSLPEFIVSFLASLSHDSGATALSISNIVGSNLFNVMVIAGASAALSPIVISKATVQKDIPLCLLASIVLSALALDTMVSAGQTNLLTRGDGIALLGFFCVYIAMNNRKIKQTESCRIVLP